MPSEGFGKRVEAARESRGLTQGELDRALGKKTGGGYINPIEKGKRGKRPSAELIQGLVRALGVTREFLLEGTGPMFAVDVPEPAKRYVEKEAPLYTSFIQWYEDLGGREYERRGQREARIVAALRRESFGRGDPGVAYWPRRIKELAAEMKNTEDLPPIDLD